MGQHQSGDQRASFGAWLPLRHSISQAVAPLRKAAQHLFSRHPNARRGPTAISAFLIFGSLLLFPTSLKLVKAVSLSGGRAGALDLLLVIAPDVALACGSLAVSLLLVRLLRGVRRGALIFALMSTLYLALVLVISALEHQAWARSASLLDWSIFWYTIEHFQDLKVVIAAETTLAGVVLMGGAGLLSLAPVLADLVATRRLGLEVMRGPRTMLVAMAIALPAAAISGMAPERPELHPLTQSASLGLLSGAFQEQPVSGRPRADFEARDVKRAQQRIAEALERAAVTRPDNADAPKNVLLVVLESTRFDATSAYVERMRTTPRLRQMARNGLLVDRAYVDVPHTSKALVSILCGYSPRMSVQITEAEPGGLPSPCLAHVLGDLGYRSAYFQSATGTYENRHQLALNVGYEQIHTRESYDEAGFEETNYLSVEDKVMVDPILRWIGKRDEKGKSRDKPFFLTALTCISHHKYGTPSEFDFKKYPRRPPRLGGRMPRPFEDFNRYLNTVRYADQFIDELIKGLKRLGRLDDTLVVVVGDHGQAFHEHGQKAHNTVIWEEGLRVPLIFFNRKAIPEARVVQGIRRQVDIAPTVLSMLGAQYPQDLFEGRDLQTSAPPDKVYSSCWYDKRCMAETSDSMRFIDHFDARPMEAYDLKADPFERRNLLRVADEQAREKWKQAAEAASTRMRARPAQIEERYQDSEPQTEDFILSEAPEPGYPIRARLEDSIELLGFDTPSTTVDPDGFWEAIVYFKCLGPSEPGWRLFGTLETVDGRHHQVDHHPGKGRLYLDQCKPGQIIADHIRVWVPGDFPPGEVRYWWGSVLLRDKGHVRRTNRRLARRRISPLQRGILVKEEALLLAKLTVRPNHRPELAKLLQTSVLKKAPRIEKPLNVRFGENLTLLDARVEPTSLRRLSSAKLTTVWRVDGKVEGPWQILVHLDSARRGYWARDAHTPLDGIHPIANWEPGTWVVDTRNLPIPHYMPHEKAQVWVGVRTRRKRMDVSDAGRATILDERALAGEVSIER
ncbi:MAG: LTA synthase family protein [Myxococcales bacterium]|nr:LTA synthase family protein [Myxococcales bacterium]